MIALVVALGGTAWALSSGSVKSKHIAKNAVKDKHLADFDTIKQRKLTPSATSASQAIARNEATKVKLYRKGPVQIYAKCFRTNADPTNPGIHLEVILKAPAGTIFSSADEDDSDNGALTGFESEEERQLATRGSFAGPGNPGTLNINDADQTLFYVTWGKRFIEGSAVAISKVGNPPGGNGPLGTGDKCLVFGTVRSG